MTSGTYRLVGVGKCTKGLKHTLLAGQPVVIGRHSTCTLVLTRVPDAASTDFEYISRQHVVIEEDPEQGWSLRDNGSRNGTAILPGGLLPAVRLTAGDYRSLNDGDVIELADSDEFRFAYQKIEAPEAVYDAEVEGKTGRLIRSEQACLQVLFRGVARRVFDLKTEPLLLGGEKDAPAPGYQTAALRGLASRGAPGVVSASNNTSVLRAGGNSLLLNLKELPANQSAVLKDGDLITIPGLPETSLLFLDSAQIPTRNLSDLLGAAESLTIGSGPDNSCRLIHPSLSRNHARIWREGDGLFILDLGSTNGTTVDGRRILDATHLDRGSRISIGRLPFVADEPCWSPAEAAPASIDVRLVKVSVEIAGKLRLHEVSLAVEQGGMVGLLGPSASGKSTLLKLLAGRYPLASGDVYVNGRSLTRASRWNWLTSLMGFSDENYEVGFVQQHDLVQPGLTVREILNYAARQMGVPAAEVAARTQNAASLCNLEPLMDRVAQHASGQLNLSGGQLKRICVALEVLRQPKILVLDEPTTGQDPKNTDDLMHLFRSLAQQGDTLLLSTHDLRNLALFDKVAVLCLGYLVYFGPPAGLAEFFGAPTPEQVYGSLPDKEELAAEARKLAERFEASAEYRRYCEAE